MNFVKDSGVPDYVISDHLPIFVIRKKERSEKVYCYSEDRNMKNDKVEDFRDTLLHDPCLEQFWEAGTVSNMWELMYRIIWKI